jgi:uncharacterized membrane protein
MKFRKFTASIATIGVFAGLAVGAEAQNERLAKAQPVLECYQAVRIANGFLPNDINNQNTVVGSIGAASGPFQRAAIYRTGVVSTLIPQLGEVESVATAINDLGTIVGMRETSVVGQFPSSQRAGFVLEANQPVRLVTARELGADATISLADINQRGDAVGSISYYPRYGGPGCMKPVFTRPAVNGRAQDLDLGSVQCDSFSSLTARSINARSEIALADFSNFGGFPNGGLMNLALLSVSPIRSMYPPTSDQLVPHKINDVGMAAGIQTNTGYPQIRNLAFWNRQTFVIISPPSPWMNLQGSIEGLNNAGQVVGTFSPQSFPASGPAVPFLHQNGTTVDLNSMLCSPLPGNARLTQARGINDRSTIVATTADSAMGPGFNSGDGYILFWQGNL